MKKALILLLFVTLLSGCAQEEAKPPIIAEETIETEGIFPGSSTNADVKMGVYENGGVKELCTVTMPADHIIASSVMDETGTEHTMLETNGSILSDVLDSLEGIYPSTAILTSTEGDSITYMILPSATITVESEKEYAPEGIDVESDAYIYQTTGQPYIMFVRNLNENWTFVLKFKGALNMPLEEIGKKFCSLVKI